MESSSSGSSKRSRAPSNATQVPSCLVDGCTADLSKCRDYHRRHKVCELHSKTPKVTIGGQEQRFCQQCSRFHSLVEFDERKRSCRKRLDGHNRRRRKPQPDSLSINSGRFLCNHPGSRYIPFSSPQIFSASTVTSAWAGPVKAESDSVIFNSQSQLNFSDGKTLFLGSSSQNYKGGKQFPFLQGTNSTIPGTSVSQPLFCPNPSASGSQKIFSDALNHVIDSNRALSLLSSHPAGTQEIGMSHMVQPDSVPSARSFISSLHYSDPAMEGEPLGPVLVSGGTVESNLRRPGGSSATASGPNHTLSFSWE